MINFQIIRPNNGMHTDGDSAGAPSPPVMPVVSDNNQFTRTTDMG